MSARVYLAGPDVFLPDPIGRAAALKAICRQYGLHGVSPLDDYEAGPGQGRQEAGRIARHNEAHIRASNAIIANLTPFRGPGADAGTVYEIGFGRALGLPVFGWSTVADDYATRVRQLSGSTPSQDASGLAIEDFGLYENLMISCALAENGMVTADSDERWHDLAPFEQCVAQAAISLGSLHRPRLVGSATA